jgi:hypothetical protein
MNTGDTEVKLQARQKSISHTSSFHLGKKSPRASPDMVMNRNIPVRQLSLKSVLMRAEVSLDDNKDV